MKITSTQDLDRLADAGKVQLTVKKPKLIFGLGTCGVASGGVPVKEFAEKYLKELKIDAEITTVGCIGLCHAEPLVDVELPGKPRITYHSMTPEKMKQVIDEHVGGGKPATEFALAQIARELSVNNEHCPICHKDKWPGVPEYQEIPFMAKQLARQPRIVLRNCGVIQPDSIEQYVARGGYRAAWKVLHSMTPEAVIEDMKKSGLRGRGGAGFSTGMKWEFARKAKGDKKYVICNADEGDPGAYMNRAVLEGDPHTVLEGMLIGAYAMGADEGYIYCRAEYPLAVETLNKAIKKAEELGILGPNAMGSKFSFKLRVMEGAGAFVCGEETALIGSIEGKRGEPHPRPPFPAQSGLFGKPTNVNNVETWNTAAIIMLKGGDWFNKIGTEKSKGTKVFSLVGKIERPGLVEIPMGTPLREVIYDIGGGIPGKRKFKAIQTGGPSGGCIPTEYLDTGIDYENLKELGAIVGSGGMVVMDEDTCMVDIARYFLSFTAEESCGQCTPCRVGLRRMLEILEKITSGKGTQEDVKNLEHLAIQVRDASLCALGGTAPNPVLTALKYFRHEFDEHIQLHHCRASTCAALFDAPCQNTCPAGTNVPGYIQLINDGKYAQAYELNLVDNPFPSVCGRVCEHPCESRCQRAQFDEPIAIRELKRYCTDRSLDENLKPVMPKMKPTGKKVAIVGGGPAGLAAAYFLARFGHSPTVFEASDKLGGMMRWAIPTYRLPHKALERDIQNVIDQGVEVKLNSRVGKGVKLADLANGYAAVFVGVGAQKDQRLGLDGEDLPGMYPGLKLLDDVNHGKKPSLGASILVIGGGNVAVDVARTAKRLGVKKVTICYRRERDDMPAYEEECVAADHEGIEYHFLAAPEKVIVANSRAVGVMFKKMKMGGYDKHGRRKPEPTSETIEVRADTIVTAIGQSVDPAFAEGLAETILGKRGTISADTYTHVTANPKIFAGGDAVSGPASVIEAIAQGKQAARNIDIFLTGKDRLADLRKKSKIKYSMRAPKNDDKRVRAHPSELVATERACNFEEVVLCMDQECAVKEGKRCLRCDIMAKEARE
jgi:NADH-quinone oxidoreductase subunit F